MNLSATTSLQSDFEKFLVTTNTFVLSPCIILVAILSILVNGLVILGILCNSSLHRPPIYLLCCVSSNDLLWGMASLIKKTIGLTNKQFWDDDKTTAFPLELLGFSTIVSCLVVLSRDRFLAVSEPVWYRSQVKTSRAVQNILVVWILCFAAAAITYGISVHTDVHAVRGLVSAVIGSVSLLGILRYQIGMLLVIRRHNRNMRGVRNIVPAVKRERDLAVAASLGVLASCLCFSPVVFIVIVSYSLGETNIGLLKPSGSLAVLLSGLATPFINCYKIKQIREATLRFVRCKGGRNSADPQTFPDSNKTNPPKDPRDSNRDKETGPEVLEARNAPQETFIAETYFTSPPVLPGVAVYNVMDLAGSEPVANEDSGEMTFETHAQLDVGITNDGSENTEL